MHPQTVGKPVVNLKVNQVKELFKRRYTLMDLGLEIVSIKQTAGKPKKKSMYLIFKNTHERN
jgi:hypothetical protein